MTVTERLKMVSKIYEEKDNCAQAVLIPYAEDIGLFPEMAERMIKGFDKGMGAVCGAMVSAFIVLNIYYGAPGQEELLQEKLKEIRAVFEEEYRSIFSSEIWRGRPQDCGQCKMLIKDIVLILESQIRKEKLG